MPQRPQDPLMELIDEFYERASQLAIKSTVTPVNASDRAGKDTTENMTREKRARLQQKRAGLQQIQRSIAKGKDMIQRTTQRIGTPGEGCADNEPARTSETKPLLIAKHFMAEWEDGEWFIYRLLDFLNPALKDGPQACFNSADELTVTQLMNALDGEYEAVAAREVSKKA